MRLFVTSVNAVTSSCNVDNLKYLRDTPVSEIFIVFSILVVQSIYEQISLINILLCYNSNRAILNSGRCHLEALHH